LQRLTDLESCVELDGKKSFQ